MSDIALPPEGFGELLQQIREVVKEELRNEQGEKLVSPAEACKIFRPKISVKTLQAWTKAGHLNRRDIGGRVYYKYSEIIEATKTLKKYKR